MNLRVLLTAVLLWTAAPLFAFETIPLVTLDGRAYVASVLVDNAGVEHEGLFLVDTGTNQTLVFTSAITPGTWTYEPAQSGTLTIEWGTTTLYGSVKTSKKPSLPELRLGTLTLYDWSVLEFAGVPGWNPEAPTIDGKTWPILGILGNDVLFRESFYLSLARNEMGWTENPPFRSSASWELVPTSAPQPSYRLRDTWGTGEESLFLIDTGSVTDNLSPASLEDPARQDPKHWLRLVSAEGTTTSGLWQGPAPLGADQPRHVLALPALADAGYQILGTATLSAWDLWFEKTGLTSVDLHVLAAPEDGRRQFASGIDWTHWGFPTALRGLYYDPATMLITAVCLWGDGTPLIPDMDVGDTVVTLPPEGSDGLVWRKPDGREVSATIPRSVLFP